MNKHTLLLIIIIAILILLLPIPMRLKDGGSIKFKSILYEITKYHKIDMNSETGYKDGIGIKILGAQIYNSTNNNILGHKIKAVVVKADEKNLLIMGIDNNTSLYTVGVKDNVKYKQGQEIEVYFNGMIMETYPAQLGGEKTIKIIKEKSEVKVPDNILRFAYSSYDKVDIMVSELTAKGISLAIIDKNELPYQYAHSYKINKKVKNKNYTGVGQKIGEDTENSTAGFTRNRT